MGYFIEHCFWAQEAVCNQVIDVGTGFMKILYLGRAPRTKETLPDFREKMSGYPTFTSIPRVDG